MFDLTLRGLRHPIDYAPFIRRNTLTLREQREEGDGIHTFIFDKPAGLSWKAGQHAVFSLPGREVTGKTWRPFSVASSPHENVIQISTIIPPEPSSFKQHLAALIPGDTIRMHGPFGEFHAGHAEKTIVGIAGGIGITPLRALAYEIEHGHLPQRTLTLIYSAREVFAYQADLDAWAAQSPNLTVTYTHTPEEVNAALKAAWQSHGNDASYFISGSPGMIGALRTSCRALGARRIVNDPFKGY